MKGQPAAFSAPREEGARHLPSAAFDQSAAGVTSAALSDRLQRLLAAAERLTVDLVAQEPVTVRLSNDTPDHAQHVADRENFDVLPVAEEDGRIVRFVRRTALLGHNSDSWQGVRFEDIHPDDIVSASSPLFELLGRFSRERPRLFVLGRRRIDGIVTVYDLNQPAAHQFAGSGGGVGASN